MKLIGVDVGGTFTDVVLTDVVSNETKIHKVASTPDDPSVAVMRGISEICEMNAVLPSDVAQIFHGTTVATNAALESKGVKTGLITTKGFRDVLHIGRHQRPQHYSIQQEIPWQERPLVRRQFRKVVTERLTPPLGKVEIPLDEDEVRQVALELKEEQVKAIAICFLYSYLNSEHELRAKAIVQEVYPECFVTTSHEVSPLYREFERFTTTAMNAYIGPLVRDYVDNIEKVITDIGFNAGLRIMRSNGGLATPLTISRLPVYTLMSGPAAGVLGGAWAGQIAERKNLITFDIGGTSADIGVVMDGEFSEASARDTFVAGFPIMVPIIDLHTLGAGGGSIAHIDEAGGLKVGPKSAGAVPGPAAYGLGGRQATVTDANIVLGRLDKDNFLGGEMALDSDAAKQVVGDIASQLNMDILELAEGIVTVLNANMANAIRAMTVQKGIDPRNFSLVASGGAGPLHGVEVAAQLGIPEVIIPPYPGINSAIGLLTSDLKYDVVRTAFLISTDMDYQVLNNDIKEMETQLHAQFKEDGLDPDVCEYRRFVDLRYVGQGYELRTELPRGQIQTAELSETLDNFHKQHEKEYGHGFPQSPVEFVNVRVTGYGEISKIKMLPEPANGSLNAAFVKKGNSVFRINGILKSFDTAFYHRDKLPVGMQIDGPVILLQKDTTIVVPPGCTFELMRNNVIIININTS